MKLKYIEIALATILLLTSAYHLVGIVNLYDVFPNRYFNHQKTAITVGGGQFNFVAHYLIPQLLKYLTCYFSAIWVACLLPNRYLVQKKVKMALATGAIGFLGCWVALALATYLSNPYKYRAVTASIYRAAYLTALLYGALTAYQLFKQLIILLITKDNNSPHKLLKIELGVFVTVWSIVLTICIGLNAYWGLSLFIALIVPCAFIIYIINLHWLIPQYYKHQNKNLFWVLELAITLGVNVVFTWLYCLKASHSVFPSLVLFIILWFAQLCVLVPLSYFVYRDRTARAAELSGLKTDLGASTAKLQFLRGQINPHFLFNALNSLYGMALLEQAEKTGEGIQLLGDMMRFMLHENNQGNIPLSSEITYLQNYISLQNLRMATSPDVKVDFDIQDTDIDGYQIAPMLLVPFVENAYKHGISFKETSWINITLSVKSNQLQFDVRNSVHPSRQNDPEKHSSGIGLQNVKQRLALLYPEQHSLTIRQTDNEFSVYLTLQLQS